MVSCSAVSTLFLINHYHSLHFSFQIIKKIEEVIDLGYTVCIWNDKRVKGWKDINDMIQSGLTSEDVIEIINSNSFTGLSAKLKLKEYKKT